MRIYGGQSGVIWYAAYALLCVCARPAKDRTGETYISSNSRSSDQETMASGYEFDELSASKSSRTFDDELEEELEEEGPSTMRAITTKTRGNAVLLPLIIEPEAEMLPPGYKGVKPPGVSHMELAAFEKPRIGLRARESAGTRADDDGNRSGGFNRGGDAYYAASRHETQLAENDRGGDSAVVFETDLTDDSENGGSERTGYVVSSDTGESYSKNRAKNREDGVAKKRDGIDEAVDRREKARNVAGYRDVYRKGEPKKHAGFYDNGRQAGRFNKRQGRYGEKYDAAERTYAKEKSNDSGLAEVETNKRRKFGKTRASRKAQGQTTADSSGTWTDS